MTPEVNEIKMDASDSESVSTLFDACMVELASGFAALPDKPEETPSSTLRALWQAAAGQPLSVQRSMGTQLPKLNEAGLLELKRLIGLRLAGTPLAHLTARQQFMGVELIATSEALIPREETELLGYAALAELRTIVREKGQATVIDVCTGSGNLALALAWHEPRARVWASDLSVGAVALARRNLGLLGLGDRVEFRVGDLLAAFDTSEFHGKVDLLVCNPPYISSSKVDGMHGEIIGHEPRLAFDGGPLGIRILLRLISEAPRFLRGGGWLIFEIGLGQGPGILKRLLQSGEYADIKELLDKHGQIRAVLARCTTSGTRLSYADSAPSKHEYFVLETNALEECENVISLWRTGLNAGNLYQAKFDWYYRANPAGLPLTLFLRCRGNESAVGVAALGRRRVRYKGGNFDTGVLVDFVVRPEHRTLFPALLLQREMRTFALRSHNLIWGTPNAKATAVFCRAGYQCIGQLKRYVRVIRSEKYLARHLPLWISRVIAPILDVLRFTALLLPEIGTRRYHTHWLASPDIRFEDLWHRSELADQLTGVRDRHFLTWRFTDNPFRTHSFFVLVSRGDQRLLGYAACEFADQTLLVRDFLVDVNVKRASARLWRGLAKEAFRRGCTSLSTEFLGDTNVHRELRAAGFSVRAQSPLYASAPERKSSLLDEQRWYITNADLDV
ncbi:MAG: HemK/PrmC family methyltransferase [Usitatibacteraceae bacterium]